MVLKPFPRVFVVVSRAHNQFKIFTLVTFTKLQYNFITGFGSLTSRRVQLSAQSSPTGTPLEIHEIYMSILWSSDRFTDLTTGTAFGILSSVHKTVVTGVTGMSCVRESTKYNHNHTVHTIIVHPSCLYNRLRYTLVLHDYRTSTLSILHYCTPTYSGKKPSHIKS